MKTALMVRGVGAVLTLMLFAWTVGTVQAADNQATGDIGGVVADLTDSNLFSITSSTLALTKTAFLTTGTQLTSGATVPAGTQVQFLIYIDNPTGAPVTNANVQDILDVAFTYQAGTIKVDNSVASGATEAAIYAAVNGTGALDDGVNGTDVAGITGTTISAGSTAGNTQLNVAANTVWALLLTVTVQ